MKIFFIFILLLSELFILDNKMIYAQFRVEEDFEGNVFPPEGWSIVNIQKGDGEWKSSNRISNSGNKCAVSNFTSSGSNNILVSKSFTPSAGDSLIFHFKQTFWNVYKDTFNILISSNDSLFSGPYSKVLGFVDSISYPVPLKYGRYSISLNGFSGQKIWVGFQHINMDGENIRLDDVRAGKPDFIDVASVNNVFPSGIISSCAFDNFIPKALIRNNGTIDQSIPFDITYVISGALSYTSVVQDTVSSGNSKTVYFEPVILTEPGMYNIKIFTSLTGDQDPGNDTLHSEFSVINSNYGGGQAINGNYYFANSTLCSDPSLSHPEFCWKDTTGSVSLILNKRDVTEGLLTGNVDNGYFSLGNIIPSGSKIKYFNADYDSLFITTNGVVGFNKNDALLSSDPSQISYLMTQPVAAFSPLWMDLDFSNDSVNGSRLSYKNSGNQLIITYDKAPVKSGGSLNYISFQVIIEHSASANSKLTVQYDRYSSGTEFIENYYSNALPPHLIGMKNKFGNNYLLYRHTDTSHVLVKGPLFNSSLALEIGPDANALNNKCSDLALSVLLEAIYPLSDSVSVTLRDSKPPYGIIETGKITVDQEGTGAGIFTMPSDHYRYYLQVNHRNSIQTWSRDSGEYFNSFDLNYDFTLDASMSYGNNMKVKNGRAFIYCGDANQDDIVDEDDLLGTYNSMNSFDEGYLAEDINNDLVVDLDDLLFVYNNSINFVSAVTP